VKAKYGEAYL
jgi:hypothetical protein